MKEDFLSTNACPEDLTHWYFHGSKIGMNHLLVSNVLEKPVRYALEEFDRFCIHYFHLRVLEDNTNLLEELKY